MRKAVRGRRLRNIATIRVARTLLLAALALPAIREVSAFQPQQLGVGLRHALIDTPSQLHAKKQSKKPQKARGGSGGFGFSSGGGFGSKNPGSSSASPAIDSSKVRSVSGYTGSGTKVLASAANNFDRLRKLFGKSATTDVYVRSPLNDERTFWFVGKVIRMIAREEGSNGDEDGSDVLEGSVWPSEEEAIISQKRLILEYAKNQLRPQNLGGPYAKNLELWSAPGDSEMDVVQNKITLVPITGSSRDLRDGFHVKDVGYNPEIYVGDEQEKGGLRVIRDSEGRPVKDVFEINN